MSSRKEENLEWSEEEERSIQSEDLARSQISGLFASGEEEETLKQAKPSLSSVPEFLAPDSNVPYIYIVLTTIYVIACTYLASTCSCASSL